MAWLMVATLKTLTIMRIKIKEAQGLRQATGRPVSTKELGLIAFPGKPENSAYQCMRRVIEGEASSLNFDALVRVADKLEVSLDYLFGRE